MNFSRSQEAAISVRNKNTVVSASAGSGKTSVLVERLCRQVLDDHISISQILAMTFTEDAAGEMKARLKARLSAEKPTDWILDQLAQLENASICTIDSFCYSLVKKYYYQIPLSYTASRHVENGPKNRQAFEKAMKTAMQSLDPHKASGLKLYFQAWNKSEKDMQAILRQFLSKADAKPDPQAWMESCRQPHAQLEALFLSWFDSRTQAMTDILESMKTAMDAMEFKKESDRKKNEDILTSKAAGLKRFQKALHESSWDEAVEIFEQYLTSTKRLPATINKVSFQTDKELYQDFEKEITAHLFSSRFWQLDEAGTQPVIDAFVDLAILLHQNFQNEKRRAGIIDFSDMEHFAWQLLQDEHLCQEVRSQYEVILVDEFQDTNDLQEAIISRIAREANVFRVGDIKQSIYGFRQARPAIMEAHMQSMRPQDITLHMAENYRSSQTIVDFVNDFFSRIMPGFKPEDAAVTGTKAQSESLQTPVRFLFTQSDVWASQQEDKADQNKLTAMSRHKRNRYDLIARDILAKKQLGTPFRSICILTRTHSCQQELKEALEAWGIPVLAEIDHGFYTNQAVQIVLAALSAMDDPTDNINAVSALCSPLGGVSIHELQAALQGRPDNIPILAWLKEKSTPLLKQWQQIEALRSLPVPELLRQIYAFQDWYLLHTTAQDKTNLDLLLEMAAEQPDISMTDFLEDMNAQSDLDKTAEAYPYGKEEDVVKVKTMHHSKGLQFPVVYILSQTRSSDKDAAGPVRSDSDLGLSFAGLDSERMLKWKSRSSLAFAMKAMDQNIAEEMRLLYVAMTRAEKELVIVDTIKSLSLYYGPLREKHRLSNESYTSWLLHTCLQQNGPKLVLDEKTKLEERPKSKRPYWKGKNRPVYTGERTAWKSATASAAKEHLHWGPIRLNPDKGTERGTLFHEMAAKLPYPYQKEDILAFAQARGVKFRSEDVARLQHLNDDHLYSQWMKMDHAFEESYVAGDGNVTTHGFMDLVVYDKDETVIVDFKSDYVTEIEELERRYRRQMEVYLDAMKMIRPGVSAKCYIYSFHFGRLWEIV